MQDYEAHQNARWHGLTLNVSTTVHHNSSVNTLSQRKH
uniref:Bm14370 n=1 Tax=Brugia malayi TaxID=6279 RepID=A0A1I9G6F2_BRUMA|nr:Bm14370 [Brugia malayi]